MELFENIIYYNNVTDKLFSVGEDYIKHPHDYAYKRYFRPTPPNIEISSILKEHFPEEARREYSSYGIVTKSISGFTRKSEPYEPPTSVIIKGAPMKLNFNSLYVDKKHFINIEIEPATYTTSGSGNAIEYLRQKSKDKFLRCTDWGNDSDNLLNYFNNLKELFPKDEDAICLAEEFYYQKFSLSRYSGLCSKYFN